MTQPDEFMLARVREALARDERTHVLDIRLRAENDKLFLLGHVDSRRRRALIEQVVRENLPAEVRVVSELAVGGYGSAEDEALA